MKILVYKIVIQTLIIGLLAGCRIDSKKRSSASVELQLEEAPVDGSNIVGHFQAKFKTLNPHVNGTIPGSANFFRVNEKIYAYVRLFAGGVRAWHMQHVYTGGRCPTLTDDSNGDGFIDINEAEVVLGKILIPLDYDISSQISGRRFFPIADLSGYYHYERITRFNRFLEDLQSEDKEPNDDLIKLSPGEGLRLAGKTVLIQGVSENVDLPETVGTKGSFKSFKTLPIVCGIFEKVVNAPGETYVQDEIPGPIGEVIEGQDRPAEDEIPETRGGSGRGDETNDSDDGNGPVSDGEGNERRDDPSSDDTEDEDGREPRRDDETSNSSTGSETENGETGEIEDDESET